MEQIDRIIAERWATLYYHRRMLRLGNWDDRGFGRAWKAILNDKAYFNFTFSFFPNKAGYTTEELRRFHNDPDYYSTIDALMDLDWNNSHNRLMGNFYAILVDVEQWLDTTIGVME